MDRFKEIELMWYMVTHIKRIEWIKNDIGRFPYHKQYIDDRVREIREEQRLYLRVKDILEKGQ